MAEAATLKKPAASSIGVPTPDEDERLRALIRAELDRHFALPVARRTLELLAEASVEPAEGSPGYRIVDRNGETRLHEVPIDKSGKKQSGPATPFTLSELVEELRTRHPELFGKAPEPVPQPAPVPAKSSAGVQETVAHVRAAGARFVETQSALAKSLASTSTDRGRALANAATETVGGWRAKLGRRSESAIADPAPRTPLRERWRALSGKTTAALHAALPARAASPVSDPGSVAEPVPVASHDDVSPRRRQIAYGLGGATAVALVAAVIVIARQPSEPSALSPTTQPSAPPAPSSAQQAQPPQAAVRPSQPAPAAPASPPADAELQPPSADDAPAPANPSDLAGVPEVIDTATLRVAGKLVRLFGVEWVRGGQAEELTKYLAGRLVTCQPAPGSSAYLCAVDGRDLSEVVLFNGGGRASSEATPDLAAAEDHARSERLGVWKR